MDTHILEQAGFTQGEIRVYLALLELGETTTGPLIDTSHISSSKVYEILEKLIQKGLASYVIKGKIKYFQPGSPKKIIDYLIKQKRKFEENEDKIGKLIPELIAKQQITEETQTTAVYEGFEGIKTVFNKILEMMQRGQEYYVFTVDEEISSEELRLFFINHHAKRVEKGIRVKLLSKKSLQKKIRDQYPRYRLSERRFVDKAFPTGIFIFKDHVMHFIYKPKTTLIVIKSKQTYESYKKFFLELWNAV